MVVKHKYSKSLVNWHMVNQNAKLSGMHAEWKL